MSDYQNNKLNQMQEKIIPESEEQLNNFQQPPTLDIKGINTVSTKAEEEVEKFNLEFSLRKQRVFKISPKSKKMNQISGKKHSFFVYIIASNNINGK